MTIISILVQHHAGPTGDVLLCKNAEGVWEFPKGRLRVNEKEPEAVERIAWEVLGMKVVAGKMTMIGRNKPSDGYVEHIYEGNITHNTNSKDNYHEYYEAVNKWQTEPVKGCYTEFKWVHPSELGQYTYAGDDVNFMAKYDSWINGREIKDVRMY